MEKGKCNLILKIIRHISAFHIYLTFPRFLLSHFLYAFKGDFLKIAVEQIGLHSRHALHITSAVPAGDFPRALLPRGMEWVRSRAAREPL